MKPNLAEAAFALAFGDLPVEAVLALREATLWRHVPAASPGRFAGLLSVAALDALLATDAARAPRVAMADAGQPGSASVAEAEYCLPDGRVDPLRGAVRQLEACPGTSRCSRRRRSRPPQVGTP